MTESQNLSKRLFVGGLSKNVSESELLERFSRFGKVSNISLKTRVDDSGASLKCFAHLNLQGDEESIKKCFNTYQNAKWKGSVMKLQYAKESILDRLQKEREERGYAETQAPKPEVEKLLPPEVISTAKGVPGTPVPGKKDWVVGKYGRAVPVLKLKKSYKIPMVKHDPSKYCHAAKVFKDEGQGSTLENSCSKLTWEINKPDSEITKKRKGEFPESSKPAKKKLTEEGLKNASITERGALLPFSNNLHDKPITQPSVHRRDDDLEVVKIGAVFKRSDEANHLKISNKFDSDIDSESDSEQKSEVVSRKPKKLNKSVENRSSVPDRKCNGFNNSEDKTIVSKTVLNATNQNESSFPANRAGIPEFKGLVMLAGLVGGSPDNKDTDKGSATKQAEVPSSGGGKLTSSETALLNGYDNNQRNSAVANSSLSFIVNRTTKPHMSIAESSIVANPVLNATIATPAPFSIVRECKDFKASTPNVAPVLTKRSPVQNTELSNSIIPGFKGLGMLANYTVVDDKKDSSQQAQSVEIDHKPPLSNYSAPTSDIKLTHSQNESPVKKKAVALESSGALSASIVSSIPSQRDSRKKSKFTTEHHEEPEDNYDSESSAATDEIILRHKEKKSSVSTPASKLEGHIKQPGHAVCPSIGKVSADRSLFMSEFVSGVDEVDPAQNPEVSSPCRPSENDSYDSDLDSNDFALVARKLQQQANLSKRGVPEKARSREKNKKLAAPQKEPVTALMSKMKDGDKQDMTDLQTKLISIAGSEPASTSKMIDSENKKQERREHLSEKEKHRAANEKRLEAVKQLAKQREQQQQLMQQALRNVDSLGENTKRIVFESSDENSEDEDIKMNSSIGGPLKNSTAQEGQKQEKPGPALFASSDEDDSDKDDYEEMFKSKPQFEGKKGEKLLKLERRIGDKRFKLDAKFAVSDSEEDDGENGEDVEAGDSKPGAHTDVNSTADSDVAAQLKEEQLSSLKVLEDVVGKSTLERFSEKISRNTKKIIDMNTVRFDPTKINLSKASASAVEKKKSVKTATAEHESKSEESPARENLMVKKRKADDVIKSSNPEDEEEGKQKQDSLKRLATKDETDSKSKTTVELSSSLLNLFKTKAQQKEVKDTGFSLSQQFGEADTDEEEETDNKHNFKSNAIFQFKEDTDAIKRLESITERSQADKGVDKQVKEADDLEEEITVSTKMPSFSESELSSEAEEVEDSRVPAVSNDEKSKNGIDQEMLDAGRTDVRFTKQQWQEQWDTLRQDIIKIYRRKHKDALKKKRIHGETKRKKEFLKNSKKAGKKNWAASKKR